MAPMNIRNQHRNGFAVARAAAACGIAAALLMASAACGGTSGTTSSQPASSASSAAQSGASPSEAAVSTSPASPAEASTESSAAAASTPICRNADLKASLSEGEGGGAGSLYPYLILTNNGADDCVVEGYPGVSLADAEGNQIGAAAQRDEAVEPSAITLKPGDSARSELQITNADMFDEADCQPTAAASMVVYPPDQTEAITIDAAGYTGCAAEDMPIITVRALVAGRE